MRGSTGEYPRSRQVEKVEKKTKKKHGRLPRSYLGATVRGVGLWEETGVNSTERERVDWSDWSSLPG